MNMFLDLAQSSAVQSGVQWLYALMIQSTLFLILVALVDRTLQHRISPDGRHSYLLISLLAVPFLPWLGRLLAPLKGFFPVAQADLLPALQFAPQQMVRQQMILHPLPENLTAADPQLYVVDTVELLPADPSFAQFLPLLVMLVYTIGVMWLIVRFLQGLLGVRAMIRQAEYVEMSTLTGWTALPAIPQRLRIGVSDGIHSPLLAGWFKPTILLPQSLILEGSQQEIRFAIEHELAHSKRNDTWTRLALVFLKTICWPQLMIWVLARRTTLLAEQACDTQVIREQTSPVAYAAFLTRVGSQHSFLSAEAALSHYPSQLLPRIQHLLHPRRSTMSKKTSFFLLSAFLVVFVATTALLANPIANPPEDIPEPPTIPDFETAPLPPTEPLEPDLLAELPELTELAEPDTRVAIEIAEDEVTEPEHPRHIVGVESEKTSDDSVHIWYTIDGERIDSLTNEELLHFTSENEAVIHMIHRNETGETMLIHQVHGDTLGDSDIGQYVVSFVDSLGSGIYRVSIGSDTLLANGMELQLRLEEAAKPIILRLDGEVGDTVLTPDGETIYIQKVSTTHNPRHAVK